MSNEAPPRVPPWIVLVIGISAVSMASTLIRLAQADIDSLAVAAWRLTLAAVILAPFALTLRREELRSLTRTEWRLALASGLFLALHFAAWVSSLALTSVAASLVLVSTSPLFVGVLAYFFLGEKLSRGMVAGMLLAVVGSAIIAVEDMNSGTHHLNGDLLALVGAIGAAGYFLIGKRLRSRLSLLGYVFPVYAIAALALMAGLILSRLIMPGGSLAGVGAALAGYGPATWLWLLLLALFPQIIGHSSLNWALRHLPATYISLSVLAEPVSSTLLAWMVLQEEPTLSAVAGGVLVLIGLLVAGRS